VAAAMSAALSMDADERTARMHRLREVVRNNDVHRWARSFYKELGS
jgi:trehalose-6-phosphate synthase